jgi:hypothetical protein
MVCCRVVCLMVCCRVVCLTFSRRRRRWTSRQSRRCIIRLFIESASLLAHYWINQLLDQQWRQTLSLTHSLGEMRHCNSNSCCALLNQSAAESNSSTSVFFPQQWRQTLASSSVRKEAASILQVLLHIVESSDTVSGRERTSRRETKSERKGEGAAKPNTFSQKPASKPRFSRKGKRHVERQQRS